MNALVPTGVTNADIYRSSTDAAELCKGIVVASAMEIQGRKYVKVEGWQAIAIAHGCTGSARDVEAIEGGVRAIGEIKRMSDGMVIATAEGFVGEDETTWYGGTARKWKWGEKRGEKIWYEEEMPKRPDYAIRAMAQTRAISRACRSAFAHVVVMMNAGLSTTPAEEVPYGGFNNDDMHNVTPPRGLARKRSSAYTDGKARMVSAHTKRENLDSAIRQELAACQTEAALDAWFENFAERTATLPLSWDEAIRDEVEKRRNELLDLMAERVG